MPQTKETPTVPRRSFPKKSAFWLKAFLQALIIAIFCFSGTNAQEPGSPEFQEIIENILEESDESLDYTTFAETLNYYYRHPLSLNEAGREDLLTFYFLTPRQINEIIAYRHRYGEFLTPYELRSIPSLDPQTIKRLLLFVDTRPAREKQQLNFRDILRYGNHYLYLRNENTLEKTKGYRITDTASARENTRGYLGNPSRIYTRYSFRFAKKISLGFTAEKDAGEEFFKGSQKRGFDFYSAHFFLSPKGKLKSLAAGDFQASFGQGVVFWSGLSFSKTPNTLNMAKNARGLQPYRSVNENLFLRGIGSTWEFGKTEISLFVSRKKRDANLTGPDTTGIENSFTSFSTGGYHRTFSELKDKNALTENLAGINVKYRSSRFDIGLTGLRGNYNGKVSTSGLYRQYTFTGPSFLNAGVNYAYTYKNIYGFGETGLSQNGAVANLHGILFNPVSALQTGLLYRNYARDYQAPFANAFREGSHTANEHGIYLAFKAQLSGNWRINGYFDRFAFPWLRYLTDAPSTGYEYLLDLEFEPASRLRMYFRWKEQEKEKNISENKTPLNYLVPYKKQNFRWQLEHRLSPHLTLRSRVAFSRFALDGKFKEKGWLIYQDLFYRFKKPRLRIAGRYAYFDIDGYRSRIYTYENNVLYSFSIPSFQGEGFRYYLLFRLTPLKDLDFYLRLARTLYIDRSVISSGYNEIEGNHKTTLSTEIRWKF